MSFDDIKTAILNLYKLTEKKLPTRFDMKGITVINYDTRNRMINEYIVKFGGRMKLTVDDSVNLVIIDMEKLAWIMFEFQSWKVKTLSKAQLDISS